MERTSELVLPIRRGKVKTPMPYTVMLRGRLRFPNVLLLRGSEYGEA